MTDGARTLGMADHGEGEIAGAVDQSSRDHDGSMTRNQRRAQSNQSSQMGKKTRGL